jgi:hypothetical protein
VIRKVKELFTRIIMKTNLLSNVVLFSAAFLLVGCNSNETTIDEKEPTIIEGEHDDEHDHDGEHDHDDEHDHEHDGELSSGRLAIAELDQPVIRIFDLEDNTLLETVNLTNPASAVYASPENRYAVAVQQEQGTVEFVDGGLWQELHDDHYDQHSDSPVLLSYSIQGVKPAQYAPRGEYAALFFDGDANTMENASLTLLSDESIAAEQVIAEHDFDTYMQGTAEVRGEFVLTTLRQSDADGTLPSQVAVFELHDDHFHQEQVLDVACPELEGSFQNEDHILFACDDGILAVEQDGSTFTASKIAYPTDIPESDRISLITGSEHSTTMLGLTPRGIFIIDPVANIISRFERSAEENAYLPRYAFDGHHEHLLLLDRNGALNAYSAEDDWELEQTIPVFEALADDVRPIIISSKAYEHVYIIHEKEVTEIDLHDGEVVGHFDLDFIPSNAAWLGVAAEGEHEHEHE